MFDRIIAFFVSIISIIVSLFSYSSASDSYEFRDLHYGTDERQIYDLNIPADNDGEVGLILYIHGGSWNAGNKDGYTNDIERVSDNHGFAAACINYRYISSDIHFEDILDDIDAALAAIKNKGLEYGVNINKVLLTGYSAGAHLSLLYAYSRIDTAPIEPVAVVSDAGPTDLIDENFYNNSALGDREFVCGLFSDACGYDFDYAHKADATEALMKASPLYYVNENTVPTVINHGAVDTVVPFTNALNLDKKLTDYGVKHEFNVFENSGHGLEADAYNTDLAYDLFIEYANEYLN